MISGSEAVVFFLASGSENHEQEFNHHRRDPCHYPQLLLAHLSLFRIVWVTFLLGAVIELDRLHIYVEQCPFLLLTFSRGFLQLLWGWLLFQDQGLGTLVWDSCRIGRRLNYFRACPILH